MTPKFRNLAGLLTVLVVGCGQSSSTPIEPAPNGPMADSGLDTGVEDMGGEPAQVELSLTPTLHDFGEVAEGVASRFDFTARNSGADRSGVLAVGLSPDVQAFSIVADTCAGEPLAAGGSCTITVEYSPGTDAESTTLFVEDGPRRLQAQVRGRPVSGPMLAVSESAIDFGPGVVDGNAVRRHVTLRNDGDEASAMLTTDVFGDSSGEFSVATDGCAARELPPGVTCDIAIDFAPTQTALAEARIEILPEGKTPIVVSLTGEGIEHPGFEVSPDSIDFGDVFLGETGDAARVTVSNESPFPTSPLSVVVSEPAVSLTSDSCSDVELAAGASCSLSLVFSASARGAMSGELTVLADRGGSQRVSLRATGVLPATLEISPAAQSFGSVNYSCQMPEATFTVTNIGDRPSGAVTTTLAGSSPDAFEVTATTCAAPLGPAESCSVDVTPVPTYVGSKAAVLEVGAAPGGTAEANLGVTFDGEAFIFPSVSFVTFEDTAVGQQSASVTVEFSNFLGPSVDVDVTVSTTEFVILSETCTNQPLAIGDSCLVELAFEPTVAGSLTALLDVTASNQACSQTRSIALSGTGV